MCYFRNNVIIASSRTKQGDTPERTDNMNTRTLPKNTTVCKELIPDVTLHKTATHRIVLNSKGEIEVVSAMGEIQNIGKEIK